MYKSGKYWIAAVAAIFSMIVDYDSVNADVNETISIQQTSTARDGSKNTGIVETASNEQRSEASEASKAETSEASKADSKSTDKPNSNNDKHSDSLNETTISGMKTDNNETYYYKNKQLQKGSQLIDGHTYYFDTETGVMKKTTLNLLPIIKFTTMV
ncbi:glucosyltransferase-S [Leuconostoc mesenteroides KFRI-MG]|nr:KxYKxGKxW signal peptide domain-containing protein [Leuconostoc mesenteroides]AHF19402.1 glucosyltransferase-S [Leuconostoc mesenteroides KFRI-MG]APE76970.1 hypothetical protein ARA02_06380 [Leuconostoc mesenteroides subsp. jonggajibkimchii]